jgi:hypothetical protein
MQPNPSNEASDRHMVVRVIAGILALLAIPSALGNLLGMFRGGEFDPMLAVLGACTILWVALCAWFALRGNRAASRARMKFVVRVGFVTGVIGFAVGFFGPFLWAPDANQGPLLGIFVTGPAGFVLGAALGWLYARLRVHPRETPSHI